MAVEGPYSSQQHDKKRHVRYWRKQKDVRGANDAQDGSQQMKGKLANYWVLDCVIYLQRLGNLCVPFM